MQSMSRYYALIVPVLAATLIAGALFALTASADSASAPVSAITSPPQGVAIPAGFVSYSIKGTATDRSGAGLARVEVTTDDFTWNRATDTSANGSWSTWTYRWGFSFAGLYKIKSRAVDKAGNVETPGPGVDVEIIP